jgi:hypothetical protein
MKDNTQILLWLDDCRDPNYDDWLIFSPINRPFYVVWVKSYNEFVKWINDNGLPTGICFDHDLGDIKEIHEKTGLDCVKFLIDYCIDNDLKLPKWNCQSANPVGRENMDKLLNNFRKHQK